jgi:hypothetical protein
MLLTAEEIDQAVSRGGRYRPPGYELESEVSKWEGEGGHLVQSSD